MAGVWPILRIGESMESGGWFCVGEFGKRQASIAMKMFYI
jgi:hypothetical protein